MIAADVAGAFDGLGAGKDDSGGNAEEPGWMSSDGVEVADGSSSMGAHEPTMTSDVTDSRQLNSSHYMAVDKSSSR